ncbi:MAG: DNA-directed RNA polymerase subunit alpha [Candidatus Cloacimonadia bacterium]
MHYLLPIQFPESIVLEEETSTSTFGRFSIGPLEPGYAITIGNTLRRVLLSSIQGAAVKFVKIEGLHHELSPIPGSSSDFIDLILKLKQIVFKTNEIKEHELTLDFKGPGKITADDINTPAELEIVNKDLELVELVDEIDFRMELWTGIGRGYVPSDEQDMEEKPIGVIPIDSVYSPVTKVNYYTMKQRVGEKIDFDRLVLEIETNGSIDPQRALFIAAKYLKDLYDNISSFQKEPEYLREIKLDPQLEEMEKLLNLEVKELELTVRSSNCLEAANIETLGDLVEKTEAEMLKYRNFGKKSLEEIRGLLAKFNLSLGMDVKAIRDNIEKAKKKMT